MIALLRILLLSSLVLSLSGFRYLDPPRKWNESEMPVEFYVGDVAPAGLSSVEETVQLLEMSYAAWENVQCSPLDFDFEEVVNNEPSFNRPDRTQLHFEGDLESGVLAAAVTHSDNDDVLSYNGKSFFRTTSMNIIYNSGVTWGSPEYIESPQCFGRHSFLGVSTHEIGHGVGLGHSCEDGEACPDPILRNATMYWSGGVCDNAQDDPNADDVTGINAIYGVAVDFDVVGTEVETTVGAAPLSVTVSVPAEYQDGRFSTFEWNFGDGSERVVLSEGDSLLGGLEHQYELEGQYTITLTASGEDEACDGEIEAEQRKVGAVLACTTPTPAADFTNEGDFVVQMVNTSPLGAFGCTTEYEWVLNGDEAGALHTYEPTYRFDEAGSHTVTLTASGPGGEASTEITIEVTRASAEGCNASIAGSAPSEFRSAAGLLALFGLGVLGALRRRS